eukprot:999036-Rhodomonas_salina.2
MRLTTTKQRQPEKCWLANEETLRGCYWQLGPQLLERLSPPCASLVGTAIRKRQFSAHQLCPLEVVEAVWRENRVLIHQLVVVGVESPEYVEQHRLLSACGDLGG